jgi:hypothetical protein
MVPATAHDWQTLEQSDRQQTPSKQCPLRHSADATQAAPISLLLPPVPPVPVVSAPAASGGDVGTSTG